MLTNLNRTNRFSSSYYSLSSLVLPLQSPSLAVISASVVAMAFTSHLSAKIVVMVKNCCWVGEEMSCCFWG
ncbi:hypothetical protein MtrunA17_Chr4g0060911 [Medicago truncatula]|uniref:Transmembrane protein n=1 Tax=Medicago truncatula TaxID=3880 RepID=A0A396IL64_MEDTR|nr:hypothetical protein MtrunA17_Chr4g0060911 [Medicago truncatula]